MNTSYCHWSACKGADSSKQHVKLDFARKELLYDIQNYAYIEGHVLGEENLKVQQTIYDIVEVGNLDRVNRKLNLVYASVVEMLYPYTKDEVCDGEEVHNVLDEPENYVIPLVLPRSYSRTTVQLLSRLIHEYMVYSVLQDWLSIANPKASENWLAKKQEAEKEIQRIKHQRCSDFVRKSSRPW